MLLLSQGFSTSLEAAVLHGNLGYGYNIFQHPPSIYMIKFDVNNISLINHGYNM